VTYPSDRFDGTEVTAVLIAYFDCLLKAIADHEARQIAMRREQHFLTTSSTLLSLAVVASPLKSKNRPIGRQGLSPKLQQGPNP